MLIILFIINFLVILIINNTGGKEAEEAEINKINILKNRGLDDSNPVDSNRTRENIFMQHNFFSCRIIFLRLRLILNITAM